MSADAVATGSSPAAFRESPGSAGGPLWARCKPFCAAAPAAVAHATAGPGLGSGGSARNAEAAADKFGAAAAGARLAATLKPAAVGPSGLLAVARSGNTPGTLAVAAPAAERPAAVLPDVASPAEALQVGAPRCSAVAAAAAVIAASDADLKSTLPPIGAPASAASAAVEHPGASGAADPAAAIGSMECAEVASAEPAALVVPCSSASSASSSTSLSSWGVSLRWKLAMSSRSRSTSFALTACDVKGQKACA